MVLFDSIELRVADCGTSLPSSHEKLSLNPLFTAKKARFGSRIDLCVAHAWRYAFASKQRERRGYHDISVSAAGRVELDFFGSREWPMDNARFTTFLVDDDPAVLRSITRLLSAAGYRTKSFSSPQKFLTAHDPSIPGCAIIDLAMAEIDGLGVQQALIKSGSNRPVIFLTGRGDVSSTVKAMKAGAVDFLTKPVEREALFSALASAAEMDMLSRQKNCETASIVERLSTLTRRERQVLEHVISGRLNKQIAASLGTVEKTVKVHRGRMMGKLDVRSVADLVRLAEKAGIEPARPVP